MKRQTIAILALLFVATTATPRAQLVEPTPTPDPQVYSDPAMNFVAPPQARLVGRSEMKLAELGDDLQTIAQWVIDPGKDTARTITLSMESFTSAPNLWEGQFESQTHSSGDGVLIRGKTPMSLTNGMPATFVEVAEGSGFQSRKIYAVVWADGQRGIVLAEAGRLGDFGADEAKALLKNVSAVAYPLNEP